MIKKISLMLLFVVGSLSCYSFGSEPVQKSQQIMVSESELFYNNIDWGNNKKLNKQVFNLAYQGYINLKRNNKISSSNNIFTICDYSLSANTPRMWIFDMKTKKVLVHSLVAHGQGTGEEYARKFSNNHESHQSSLGFYRTESTYNGSNGYSLKLTGLDQGFNCNAMDRAIVIHGADYVSNDFIKANQRLGRSWGCPALPQKTATSIINRIKNGSCLFIYYPETKYLTRSKWLKTNMPMIAMNDSQQNSTAKTNTKKNYKPFAAKQYTFNIVEQKHRFSDGGSQNQKL